MPRTCGGVVDTQFFDVTAIKTETVETVINHVAIESVCSAPAKMVNGLGCEDAFCLPRTACTYECTTTTITTICLNATHAICVDNSPHDLRRFRYI